MDWVQFESSRLCCPAFADELEGREDLEGLQSSAEIIGACEGSEVCFQLTMAVVVVALDGGFLDGPVHSLDLAVGYAFPMLMTYFLSASAQLTTQACIPV